MTKKASAIKSLGFFALGVMVFFGFRWGFYEPYVIPSGSMIPSLLINDHILVRKFEYGLRWPFTDAWMLGPKMPDRGDVVVFRSVNDSNFFMVKRVVGLPGDKLKISSEGFITLNGEEVPIEKTNLETVNDHLKQTLDNRDIRRSVVSSEFYEEDLEGLKHYILLDRGGLTVGGEYEVPAGELFVMGDNRHSSQDSRYWGTLPMVNLLGKATRVWLSCQKGVKSQQILCDPRAIRWQRMFYAIE